MTTYWMVTADRARARIFELADKHATPVEKADLVHPASRQREQQLETDRPGRSFDSAGEGRHAMADNDAHDEEAELFAREVARYLDHERGCNAFDRIALVAPPQFLGMLRAALSSPLRKCVETTLDKRLVDAAPEDIQKALFALR